MTEKTPLIGILMGSDSDWEIVKSASETLRSFGIAHEVRVISAHRTPHVAADYATQARSRGMKALICAAGGAAHLGGVVAAHTTLPVIGIPVAGGALNGMDALLATVQMPAGNPVATEAVGSAGPVNAALLALQIISLGDPAVEAKLDEHKLTLARKVEEGNARVQQKLAAASHG